jgi:hypothetical protein
MSELIHCDITHLVLWLYVDFLWLFYSSGAPPPPKKQYLSNKLKRYHQKDKSDTEKNILVVKTEKLLISDRIAYVIKMREW